MKKSIITIIIAVLAILPAYALTTEEYAKQAATKIEAKDYKGAVNAYTEAIKLNPKNADYYYQKAVLELMNLGEYKQAQTDIDAAISIDPKNTGYLGVGIFLKEAYAHPKAFKWFSKAMEEYDNGKYFESITDTSKAIELNPSFAFYYVIRGDSKANNNEDPAIALADYDKAISLEQEKVLKDLIIKAKDNTLGSWNFNIQNKIYKKDYTGGLLDVNKLIDLAPYYTDYYMSRAIIYQYLKQYDNAMSDIDKAISLSPKPEYKEFRFVLEEAKTHPDAYQLFLSAQDKLYKKDYAGVIEDSSQAIKSSPTFGDYYVIRAIAKNKLKDYKGALSDMEKAASVDPDNKTKNFATEILLSHIKKNMAQK